MYSTKIKVIITLSHHIIGIYVVLEYMVGDLGVHPTTLYTESQVKCIMHQTLKGLKYMHDQQMIHRDVKPGNLLISSQGVVKYSDFGLARFYDKDEVKDTEDEDARLTRNVCTRYYRPPEVLYGSYQYDSSIDIWAAGCVLAELALNEFLFKGENEIDQLSKIFTTLGNANADTWPGVENLPNYIEFECQVVNDLDSLFVNQSDDFRDLISKMVALNPANRITVEEALAHSFFTSDSKMCSPSDLPLPEVQAEKLDAFTDSD